MVPNITDATASNATTPLLVLPQEVKDLIYEFACGGHLIHINMVPPDRRLDIKKLFQFSNTICENYITEEEDEHEFNDQTQNEWSAPKTKSHHDHCHVDTELRPSLHLGFLRTCRQVYNEGRQVPYSSNIFSFHFHFVLLHFMNPQVNKGAGNNLAIRFLHLQMSLGENCGDLRYWSQASTLCTQRLTNVQRLNIRLIWEPTLQMPSYNGVVRTTDGSKGRNARDLERMMVTLGGLPLKGAILVIEEYVLSTGSRWSMAENQAWAHYLKGKLLQASTAGSHTGEGWGIQRTL